METWDRYLNEARDFPTLINTLVAQRENIYTIGMMTAENPNAQQASVEDNKIYNNELEQELRSMNLGYRKIRGKFGNYENSYLIPNIGKEEMIYLGQKFQQEAVIWGQLIEDRFVFEYIESATGQTTDKRDIVLIGKDIQSKEDYYSQSAKGPEKFVIPFFDDEYESVTEHNMPNPEYNGPLINEINEKIQKTLEPNRTQKSVWYNRGLIKQLRKKTY
jgi:hypothetical protein